MYIAGVPTASKTGTSDKGGQAKDIWMASYSPALAMTVWLGNSDTSTLKNGNSLIPGAIIATVMSYAHTDVYAKEGKWKTNDWFTAPAGIQKIGGEIWPSWYSKSQGQTNAKLTFDSVSKKKATSCTPDGAKIEVDVTKSVDIVTKKDVFVAPTGYDATKEDDVHKCDDAKPTIAAVSATSGSPSTLSVTVTKGTFALSSVDISVDGTVIKSIPITDSGTFTTSYTFTTSGVHKISASVSDAGKYSATGTTSITTS